MLAALAALPSPTLPTRHSTPGLSSSLLLDPGHQGFLHLLQVKCSEPLAQSSFSPALADLKQAL
jgi:hypothetical protein